METAPTFYRFIFLTIIKTNPTLNRHTGAYRSGGQLRPPDFREDAPTSTRQFIKGFL